MTVVGDRNKAKTQCKNGHPYSPENTIHRKDGGRDCRICKRASGRKHHHIKQRRKGAGRQKTQKAQIRQDALWARFLALPDCRYKELMLEAHYLYSLWLKETQANPKRKHPNLRVGKEAGE